jgi:hypothetical protein
VPGVQQQASSRPPPRPPVDLAQRLFTERQAALREAALQRDELLSVQQQNQPGLNPLRQAQRESDRLQVLRDTQLLETQRIDVRQLDTPRSAERLITQRDTERLDQARLEGQRQSQRALAAQDAERIETARLDERREAERVQEQEETERLEEQRLEKEREAERVREQEDAQRVQAQREAERVAAEPEQAPRDSERALAERAVSAYRSESERAVAEANAARVEAEQPLNDQLQLARERLDALGTQRIDRVDVSTASLSRLAF